MLSNVKIHETETVINGFVCKAGFASWEEDSVFYASSGHISNDELLIYKKSDDDFCSELVSLDEYQEVIEGIADFKEAQAIEEAKVSLIDKHPYVSESKFSFTDTVAGEKCNDGGEYGDYTEYCPTHVPGVYAVFSETTCILMPRYEYLGIFPLTVEEYNSKRAASDKIEEEGSLY